MLSSTQDKNFIQVNCLAIGCSYSAKFAFGSSADKKRAKRAIGADMRKHELTQFNLERTPGTADCTLTKHEQNTWDALKVGLDKSPVEFRKWDANVLQAKCPHHPLHLPSERFVEVHLRNTVTVTLEGIPSKLNLTYHWPQVQRAYLKAEQAEERKRKRKGIEFTLARAAVRGYKRFCTAHTQPSAHAPPSEVQAWAKRAMQGTRAFINVAAIAAAEKAALTGHKVQHSPIQDAVELRAEVLGCITKGHFHKAVHISSAEILEAAATL